MGKRTSKLESHFLRLWEMLAPDQPEPKRELRFCDGRMWRFDFAWPAYRVAVELEGGVFAVPVKCNHCHKKVTWPIKKRDGSPTGKRVHVMGSTGGHTRGRMFAENCDKYNAAAASGWRVLRYTVAHLEEQPVQMIEQIVALLAEGKVVDADEQLTLPLDAKKGE